MHDFELLLNLLFLITNFITNYFLKKKTIISINNIIY